MKIFVICVVGIILLSCNHSDCTNGIKDGKESGIDCGGGCPNCLLETVEEVNNEEEIYIDSIYNQNEIFQKLQGLWYTNSKIIQTYNSDNDTVETNLHVYKNYSPKTSFSDTISPNLFKYYLYVKGNIIEENYPNVNVYGYDTLQNSIIINHYYPKV